LSWDLGRRLLDTGVVQPGELRRAVYESMTRNKPFPKALADCSASARAFLERPVEDPGHPTIRSVVPQVDLMATIPPGLPERLLAIPIRKDPRTGTVDVAVVDPYDTHVAAELAFHLRAPVRPIAAPLPEIERALLLIGAPRKRDPLASTADYAVAPPQPHPQPSAAPATTPVGEKPLSAPPGPPGEEDAVPLVRRSRTSLGPRVPLETARSRTPTQRPSAPEPPLSVQPSLPAPPPVPAPTQTTSTDRGRPEHPGDVVPLSRRRATLAPPTTDPFDRTKSDPSRSAPVHVVVDFGPSAREERQAAEAGTRRGKLQPKRPPFPSLTRVLEAIDVANDRDALIAGLLRGLATTSTAAALFAPRRGKFAGIGAIGDLEPSRVHDVLLPAKGTIADAIARGERIGTIDPKTDRELHAALQLERYTSVHVLVHPVFVADKPALLLVSYGMGDVLESSRRARVLATAAGAAMDRMLRR